MRFDGKLIFITGGASGIGAACARLFAGRGGRVVIADRNLAAAQALAAELGATSMLLDVADEASVRQVAQAVEAEHGAADVLVNSAGVLQRTVPPSELKMSEWDLVARIDLRGTYLCCSIFGTAMALRGRGAIVNIASVAGMGSGPLHAYGPAKAGVINLTECLAGEWGASGVRVNAVSPGFTATPAVRKGLDNATLDIDAIKRTTAIGRVLQPEEIAAEVLFLASDLASAITGVNLPVDGGYRVAAPWAGYGGPRASVAA